MSFPRMTFPMTVDFGSTEYWINDTGPFKYGSAVTEFFCGDDLVDNAGDGLLLMRRLEEVLKAFGGHLHPYVQEPLAPMSKFSWPERTPIEGPLYFAFHPVDGDKGVMVERWTVSCLRDFLYLELGKAIEKGNAPRQCRLCGRWFLHEQGDKTVYCERTAPGETEKTCREVGARVVFEKKIQEEDAWKIYKRAYKKYYARVMKGNMSREEFNDWVKFAMSQRDATIFFLAGTDDLKTRSVLIEQLREELNRL